MLPTQLASKKFSRMSPWDILDLCFVLFLVPLAQGWVINRMRPVKEDKATSTFLQTVECNTFMMVYPIARPMSLVNCLLHYILAIKEDPELLRSQIFTQVPHFTKLGFEKLKIHDQAQLTVYTQMTLTSS